MPASGRSEPDDAMQDIQVSESRAPLEKGKRLVLKAGQGVVGQGSREEEGQAWPWGKGAPGHEPCLTPTASLIQVTLGHCTHHRTLQQRRKLEK